MIKTIVTQSELIEINITSEGFSILNRVKRKHTTENNHNKALLGIPCIDYQNK